MGDGRIIGLTGGIATGKSTVARYLAQTYQWPVLDADLYAREAVQLGSPILHRIRQRYGSTILLEDGRLDRTQLGSIVFRDPTELRWLEEQIHPYVRQRFVDAIEQIPDPRESVAVPTPIVLVIPLLFEAEMDDLVREVWVVYCSPEQQLERLMQRDRLSRESAIARIEAQMPMAVKCDRSDLVLDNSAGADLWMKQVALDILTASSGR